MRSEQVTRKETVQPVVEDDPAVVRLGSRQREKDTIIDFQFVAKRWGISEILSIDTKDIAVAEWVRLKCKYGCKNFGKSWCCPPETPTPEETRALLSEYRKALLICGSTKSTHFYREDHQKRRKQVHVWKGTIAIERQLFLHGYYKVFSLVSESCALCKECAYPRECKFPMDRRPSIESLSIDVFQTLKNIGKGFTIATDVMEEHHCYSIILLE